MHIKALHYLAAVTLSSVWPTAIAAVVVARLYVVVVVTLAISLVVGSTASGGLEVRVQAFALAGLMRMRKRVGTKDMRLFELVTCTHLTHKCQTQTNAKITNLCAVELLFVCAAIAAVVVARRLVVVVVAVAIALVILVATVWLFRWLVVGILAFALHVLDTRTRETDAAASNNK